MKTEFEHAFEEIAESRDLPREVILDALSQALVSAYKKEFGIGSSQQVTAYIDPTTWRERIHVEKEVVEQVTDERTEVDLETARFYQPESQYNDIVMVQLEGKTARRFGRIAAQTAKQVILQKIREAERNQLFDEFSAKEGDVVSATVQSVNSTMYTLSLGRAEAIMPRAQQIPHEKYKQHDRIRVYIMEVKRTTRGPQIVVSRAHRGMLRRLLEFEVPEIANGQVEIKGIVREPGARSKVAVYALQEGIDPIGACIGRTGARIQSITRELHGEDIDVVEWNPNQEKFIAEALRPARVEGVFLDDDPMTGRTALVIVPDDSLPNSIGKQGQNARLAAKLTGWRIDIKGLTEATQEALEAVRESPLLRDVAAQTDLVENIERIYQKRVAQRVTTQEEFTQMRRFVEVVQRRFMLDRDQKRRKRLEEISALKATLPPGAFSMPVSELKVSPNIREALLPLVNVGEVLLAFLVDEMRVRRLLVDSPEEALQELQGALDALVIPDHYEQEAQQTADAAKKAADEQAALLAQQEAELARASRDMETAQRPAFGDMPDPAFGQPGRKPAPDARPARAFAPPEEFMPTPATFEEDRDVDDDKKGKKKKGRQFVFDERAGSVVSKKQRKGSRERGGWDWDQEE
jgi:N utilization substance protein A